MPRHVIVCVETNLFVDAFEGKILDRRGVELMLQGMGLDLRDEYVAKDPATSTYERLLRNLRHLHTDGAQHGDAVAQQALVGLLMQSRVLLGDREDREGLQAGLEHLSAKLGRLEFSN